MDITRLFLDQLARETPTTRKALERVPEGKNDWKPHPKSMPLGYLSGLVAIMPSWIAMIVERDDLDLAAGAKPPDAASNRDLVQTFDRSVESAQRALSGTTEDHLLTVWRLRAGERILDARPRHLQIADTFSHLAHHRGQLTVYLRLNDRPVPSIYGPTADERA